MMKQFAKTDLVYLVNTSPAVFKELESHGFFFSRNNEDKESTEYIIASATAPDLHETEARSLIMTWESAMLRIAQAGDQAFPAIKMNDLADCSYDAIYNYFGNRIALIQGDTVEDVLHCFRLTPWNLGIFYHVACMGNWQEVVVEQLDLLRKSGLNGVHVSLLGSDGDRDRFQDYAKQAEIDISIEYHSYNLDMYEIPAFRAIDAWARDRDGAYLLYFHTKGVSDPNSKLKKNWRILMQRCVIEKWRENCISLRDGYDVVGTTWRTGPIPHFSGNFFMARVDYIRSLGKFIDFYRSPYPSTSQRPRLTAEFWIGSGPRDPRVKTWSPLPGKIGHPEFWVNLHDRLHGDFADLAEALTDLKWHHRSGVINELVKLLGLETYLEIGTGDTACFTFVNCDDCYYLDVVGLAREGNTGLSVSDEFFQDNMKKFDIILVDGIHESEQVRRDLDNALNALSANGVVVCHNINPSTEEMQSMPRRQDEWTGDGWKAWAQLRRLRTDLSLIAIDSDYGIGLILPFPDLVPKPVVFHRHDLTWENLVNSREELLGLVSGEDAQQLITSYISREHLLPK